ncbi:MAG: MFS transporter [Burkholderiaceae bacterium]
MIRSVAAISTLLSGMGILLVGSGLLGLLIALRGANEGFSGLTIGLLMSGFYVGYIIGARLCPRIIREVGHIRAFTAFAASGAALSLAYGLVVDPVFWWVLRVLTGVSLIGIYMVIESWLNERATTDRGQIFSVYMMVNLVAVALGQVLILSRGARQPGLFCDGLHLVLHGPVADRAHTRRAAPADPHRAAVASAAVQDDPGRYRGGTGLGPGDRLFWSLGAVYARNLGLDDGQVAGFIVAAILGGATLQWPIGWLSDHFDRRHVLAGVGLGTAAALIALFLGGNARIELLTIKAFLFGGFSFTLYSLSVAQTHDRFSMSEVLEATKSLLMLHGIGAAIGPVLTGAAMTWTGAGFPIALATMVLAMTIFTVARIRIDPPVLAQDKTLFAPIEQTSAVAMDLDPRTPTVEPDPSDGPDTQHAPMSDTAEETIV